MPRELPESEVFALLGKRRRRLAIEALRDVSTPCTVFELAERVADREHGDPSPRNIETIHLSLCHNHLPRLEDAGVVECNGKAGTVRPGPQFGAPVRMLERVGAGDLPWSDG